MDPIRLQKQLKDNNLDLQDFCKDLKNWGDEMKQKEEHLKLDKQNAKNTAMNMKIYKESTNAAYYDSEELSDEFDENALELAATAKDKGNKFFKSGRFNEAIKAYSQAIEIHRYDPTFYCNRALCYNKLNEFNQAELDCTTALQLDKHYVKAYHRRAIARESLGYYKDAHEDLTYALLLEPKNKESLELLDKINKKLLNEDVRPQSKFSQSRKKSSISYKGSGDRQAVKNDVVEKLNKPLVVKETKKDIVINEVKSNKKVETHEKADTVINEVKSKKIEVNEKPGAFIKEVKSNKKVDVNEKPGAVINEVKSKKIEVNEKPSAFIKEVKSNKKVDVNEKPAAVINEVKTNEVQIIEKTDIGMTEVKTVKKVQFIDKPIIQDKDTDVVKVENIDTSIKWPMGDDVILVKPIPKSKHKSLVPLKKQTIITTNKLDIIKKSKKLLDVPAKKVQERPKEMIEYEEERLKFISCEKSIMEKNSLFSYWDCSALNLDFNMLEHPIPKTSVQFYSTWKILDDNMRLLYLLQINPLGYTALFKDSLSNKVFSDIVRIIRKQKNGGFECLFGFTRVSRFTAVVMFLNKTDLKYLDEHYELMKTSNKYTLDELNCVYQNKYYLKYK